ncbi:MAG: hypothetical protein L5656_04120 [Thermanaeromonas sp.]|uniref:hypothetical protein n=1 Tax=Thermanaeromonas sp. TaxID=2003697 RepID=UPI0024400003|nr:hypothetical protein [Thermanaeromonas sp.]MCG0277704.1 hypothetical protein [Thermanaeromonas sp.]
MSEVKKESFRKKYKSEGQLAAFIMMWLDFPLLYSGVVNHNAYVIVAGFLVLLAAGVITYYFS